MFFFFFFFEQEVIDFIKQSLQGDESLEAGKIEEKFAYDYLLPKGCAKLCLPKMTAIEVKKNLAPGLLSILISDAENAYRTKEFNHFLVLYEEGNVYYDWIPEEIKGFVSFLSKKEIEAKASSISIVQKTFEWESVRDLRINKLKSETRKGQNTLFVGAGLSCSLGVPSWYDLLKNLHKCIRKNIADYPDFRSITNDSSDSYLITARFLTEAADKYKFAIVKEIRKQLYKRSKIESSLMDAVIELLKQNRVGEVITYNYDTLLEQRMTKEEINNAPVDGKNRRVKNAIPVMHVHGVIDPVDNTFDNGVVLSEDKYHHLYRDSYHWANVAQLYALTHTTCIFVGLSMTDPSLRRLLDIAYQQGSQDVEHYAFLIRTEFKCHKETESVFSQMGVNIIWCEDRADISNQLMRIV